MEEVKQKKSSSMFVIRLSKENLDIKERIKQLADDEGLSLNAYMNDVLQKLVSGS